MCTLHTQSLRKMCGMCDNFFTLVSCIFFTLQMIFNGKFRTEFKVIIRGVYVIFFFFFFEKTLEIIHVLL